MITDSDSDGRSNTVFTFQNQTQKVHAKGPHGNSNLTSLSFRNNNTLTSSLNVPWNTVRPRYAESACDVRSYRRDTSPTMSLCSASGLHLQPQSVCNPRAGSPSMSMRSFRTVDTNATLSAIDIASALQNSKFNKVEARILRDAFNRYIKKKARRKVEKRRKIRKFVKLRQRRSGGESGDISSDSSLSSDECKSYHSSRTALSSVRSNNTDFTDIRKVMNESNMYRNSTNNFRQNTFRGLCPPMQTIMNSNNMQYNMQYQSHIPALSQENRFDSSVMVPRRDTYTSSSSRSIQGDGFTRMQRHQLPANRFKMTQKERFETGFQLPSQRFQSTHSVSSTSRARGLQSVDEDSILPVRPRQRDSLSSISDHDDIFSESIAAQNSAQRQGKRPLEDGGLIVPNEKRSKFSSPQKLNAKSKPFTPRQTKSTFSIERNTKDFVFAKPQFPVSRLVKAKNTDKKKSQPTPREQIPKSPKQTQNVVAKQIPKSPKQTQNVVAKQIPKSPNSTQNIVTKQTPKSPKQKITKQPQKLNTLKNTKKTQNLLPEILVSSNLPTDILISKSAQLLDGPEPEPAPITKAATQKAKECDQSVLTQNSTDLSMRPSFIKRKLFSQKIDVSDKNTSSDSLQAASPSNLYSAIQKEKNRTRKIVASQSCMSRDIVTNESNLLDLIHKIVPPDRMSVTSATNRSEMQSSKTNKTTPDNANQWDVTNIITVSKEADADNVSESFTDEEIFNKTVVEGNKNITQKNQNITQKNREKEDMAIKTQSNKNDNAIKQNGATKTVPYSMKQCLDQTGRSQKKVEKEQNPPTRINGVSKPNLKQSALKTSKPRNINNMNMSRRNQPQNKRPEMMSPGESDVLLGFNQTVGKSIKLFWDSDFESDVEPDARTPQKTPESHKAEQVTTGNVEKTTNKLKAVLNNEISNTENSKGFAEEPSQSAFNKIPKVSIEKANIKPSDKVASKRNEKVAPKTGSVKNKPSIQENSTEKSKTAIKTLKSKKTELPEKENTVPNNIAINTIQKAITETVIQPNKVIDNRIVNKKSKTIKVNNNTIRFRSNKNEKADKLLDESSDAHCRSLRSRNVDLSNSVKPNSNNYMSLRSRSIDLSNSNSNSSNTTKNTRKPALKNVEKKAAIKKNLKRMNNEKSELSEPSFTLTSDQPVHKRRRLGDITSSIQLRKRTNDVSLTLFPNKRTTKKVSRAASRDTKASSKLNGSRELIALRNISISMPCSAKRTPILPKPYIIQY